MILSWGCGGLVTTCRGFTLFEWDLKPYHRKISLYKLILFVLRVSHCFGRFLTNWTLLAPLLGRYYGSVSYLRQILSDNDTWTPELRNTQSKHILRCVDTLTAVRRLDGEYEI